MGKPGYIFLILALFALVSGAYALTKPTPVYATDFSQNPSWTTNNPARNLWDRPTERYHYFLQDSTGAYVFKNIPYNGESFILMFDCTPVRDDPLSNFRFGLGDNDMFPDDGVTIHFEMTNDNDGPIFWLHALDRNLHRLEVNSLRSSYGGVTVHYTTNTTYHVKIDYNQPLKTVSIEVSRADGVPVWNAAVTGTGSFSSIDRIYMTTLNDVENAQSVAEGYVDNVHFSTYEILPDPTPESTGPTIATPDVTTLPTYEITQVTVRTMTG
ncbi:MAG: hypothetical protein LUQ40_01805, partial [Methanomicrobiales archaeon]|nr:hypothetical protein [Methanomicrobiales archaeon]